MSRKKLIHLTNTNGTSYFVNPKTLTIYIELKCNMSDGFIEEAKQAESLAFITINNKQIMCIDSDFLEHKWSDRDQNVIDGIEKMRNLIIDKINEREAGSINDRSNIVSTSTRNNPR